MKRVESLRPGVWYLVTAVWIGQLWAAPEPAAPFWRSKEKYYARVKAGEPIVGVTTTTLDGPTRRLLITGGGRVPAPRQFSFDFSKRLDRVAMTSGYVERASMNPARDRLHLIFKALGHRAEFDIKVGVDDTAHRLTFEVVGGPLGGLTSTLDFTAVDAGNTEVAIVGHYDYRSFPVKGALLTVGMEGVFKSMAGRLRDAVVSEMKAVDKPSPGVEHSAPSSRRP